MNTHGNTCPATPPRPYGRVQSAHQLGDLVLYARHLCAGHFSRPGMVITADLPRPDAGDAGDGGSIPFCRPPAGTLWRSKGGDGRNAADRRKLRLYGVYPDALWLVRRLAGHGRGNAPVAVRCAFRRAGQPLRTTGAKNNLARHAGGRAGLCRLLAAGRCAASRDVLAGRITHLCPAWPAERVADPHASPTAADGDDENRRTAAEQRAPKRLALCRLHCPHHLCL